MANSHKLLLPLISSALLLLSLSLPLVFSSVTAAEVSSFFPSLRSWLRPPYLYFIINCIIISIAASSRLHYHHHHHHSTASATSASVTDPPPPVGNVAVGNGAGRFGSYGAELVKDVVTVDDDAEEFVPYDAVSMKDDAEQLVAYDAVLVKDVEVVEERAEDKAVTVDEMEYDVAVDGSYFGGEDEVDLRSTWTPPPPPPPPPFPLMRQQAVVNLPEMTSAAAEKPPVSVRFGHHRKPNRGAPEGGKALRVLRSKQHDTLENTWKAITEGRHMPLTRHLKKSDTWETQGRQINVDPQAVKKSETFRDRTSNLNPSPTRLKKEPSLSQDDLNRRVEAFINKFNEDMRLQRQQSLQQFMEMMNRSA